MEPTARVKETLGDMEIIIMKEIIENRERTRKNPKPEDREPSP